MLDVFSPFILWPVGVALGGLLFLEIAKQCWRVDPAPRGVEARSKATRAGCRKRSAPPGESALAKPTCKSSTNIRWERARLVDPVGQPEPDSTRGHSDGQHPRDRRRRCHRLRQRPGGV